MTTNGMLTLDPVDYWELQTKIERVRALELERMAWLAVRRFIGISRSASDKAQQPEIPALLLT